MGTRVYVGNLPSDVQVKELEDIFSRYGKFSTIDLKGREGEPRFAFVEYEENRDASEAVRAENGADFAGDRLRVELARGDRFRGGPGGAPGGYGGYGGGGGGYRDRGPYNDPYDRGYRGGGGGRDYYDRGPPSRYDDYGRGGGGPRGGLGPSPYGPSRKTEFEVSVSGLDPSMSWQDLKDHFRTLRLEATHADVDRRGNGTAMFGSREDMEDAVKQGDNSEMRNMRGTCTLRVEYMDSRGGGGSRGRDDRDRDRDRSPGDRDRDYDRDRDRGRRDSRSPSDDRRD